VVAEAVVVGEQLHLWVAQAVLAVAVVLTTQELFMQVALELARKVLLVAMEL
jgi:hypothetical protein